MTRWSNGYCSSTADNRKRDLELARAGSQRDNNTLHTEPRAARLFLLARYSPRPGERCRYSAKLASVPKPEVANA